MPRDPGEPTSSADVLAQTGDWLIRDARFLPGNKEILAHFCERVAGAGIPIDRVSLHQLAFHPQYRGVARVWWSDKPMDELFFDHGIEKTTTYRQNPLRPVIEEGKTVEYRLDGNETNYPYPMLGELRERGFTHYVIAPLKYAIGITNGFSWATRRPGGFTPGEMRFFHAILAPYAAVAELKALRRFIGGILETYVGTEAGKLILDGQVQRGDTRAITAALMLVDLRDFTAMSDRLSPRAVIRTLNQYFDCVMPPVYENGGEVVEIMGDGVLAIFQHGHDRTAAEACESALAAATAGLAALGERNRAHPATPLRAGVALHYGTVSYGNIGAGNRLDFTVIGPDVNMTSRIERLCRELDRNLITSETFADTLARPMWEIGHFDLRGFVKMQRLFELPPA